MSNEPKSEPSDAGTVEGTVEAFKTIMANIPEDTNHQCWCCGVTGGHHKDCAEGLARKIATHEALAAIQPKSSEPSQWAIEAVQEIKRRVGGVHDWPATLMEQVAGPVASAIDAACAAKDATIKTMCADWADDDTRVKKLAAPYIGDFDAARSPEERGLGFRGVVDVTEALVANLEANDAEIARLKQWQTNACEAFNEKDEKLAVKDQRIAAMTALLDELPHLNIYQHWVVWRVARPELVPECVPHCPRCAWEKLQAQWKATP